MFEIRWGEQGTVIVEGRLDAAQAPRAESFLAGLSGPTVLDVSRLQYVSSLGLGVLLRTEKRLRQVGAGLRLVNANRHIREVFSFSGFDKIIPIEGPPGE